jgi:hypothetical protein
MRPLRNLAFVLCTVALVACGGSGSAGSTTPQGSEPPPAAVPLAQLVDPAAIGIVHADLSALARSQHYQTFVDLLSLALEIYDPSAASLVGILLHSTEVVMFITLDEGGDLHPVLLLRGLYGAHEVSSVFPESLEITETNEHGIRMFRGADGLLAAVGDHTVILGRRQAAEAAVQRQLEGGGHYPNEDAFGTLVTDLGIERAQIGYAVAFNDRIRHGLAEEAGIPEAVLAPFSGMGVQVTVTTGVEVRGTIMSESSIQAAAMLVLANQIIARLRHDPEVRAFGFEGALGAILLRRDGGNIMLSMSLSDEQVRASAAQMRQGLEAERAAAREASGGTAPAPSQAE